MMKNHDSDVWDDETPSTKGVRGIYVAVSGNTAGGKSSLISAVCERARGEGHEAVGINERAFHHAYLRLMFSEPEKFAFPVQLEFMIQRHLILLRQLSLGRIVIIERSHLDDIIFLQEHADAGVISPRQLKAYKDLAEVLHERIPAPDVLVLINPDPMLSIERLRLAEESGERPREFPSEMAKERWVFRWHNLYQNLHSSFRDSLRLDPAFSDTEIIDIDSTQPTTKAADMVMDCINNRLHRLELRKRAIYGSSPLMRQPVNK